MGRLKRTNKSNQKTQCINIKPGNERRKTLNKKTGFKKSLTLALCFILVFGNCGVVHATEGEAVYQENNTEYEENQEVNENQETEPEAESEQETAAEEQQQEPEEEIIKKITISNDNLSFGTVTTGDAVQPKTFTVKNEGNRPINVKWSQTDPDSAFTLTALSDTTLNPDASLECSVSLKEGIGKGDYSSTITFEDTEEPSSNATIGISVKVTEKEVTPKPQPKPQPKPEKKPQEKPETKPENKTNKKTAHYRIEAKAHPQRAAYISGTGTFEKGTRTTLTVYIDDGYHFNGWYKNGDLVSSNASISIENISKNESYVADFTAEKHKVKAVSCNKEYGTVKGGGMIEDGETAELKAVPKKGYRFKGWYQKDKRISKDAHIEIRNVRENLKFTAVFVPEKHKVIVNTFPKDAGKVTGSGRYKDKTDVVITAEAKKGYVFKGFLLNNQVITENNSYRIKGVDRDMSLTAYFEKEEVKKYTLKSGVASKGGVISPSGEIDISEKGTLTYNITPENGYGILEVSVDGKKMGPIKSYTFENIKGDHTISVAFAPKKNNEKKVKPEKIITTKEAKQYKAEKLFPATADDEKRESVAITPETYKKMKKDGTIEEVWKVKKQNVVGMDDTKKLKKETDDYNYDEAIGVYQFLDMSPDEVENSIVEGKDIPVIKAAYEEGTLTRAELELCVKRILDMFTKLI